MTDKELMQQVLEALTAYDGTNGASQRKRVLAALRERLAQPEQGPVAWLHTKIEGVAVPHRPADLDKHPDRWEALYRTPPPCPTCEALARTVMLDQTSHDNQRKWIDLTDDEIIDVLHPLVMADMSDEATDYEIARAIEAKLKERNT
jgi:hypothetical protein